MAVPAKVLHALALVAKIEAAYGTAIALTPASDSIQMQFDKNDPAAVIQQKYLTDGDIGPSISSLGQIQRVSPTASYGEGSIPALLRLPAIAYSAAVVPNLHTLLKIAGLDATGAFGAGVEKWTYAPTPAGVTYASATAAFYERGESVQLTGVLANLQIAGKDGKPPKFTFPIKGIWGFPADAIPLIPATVAYPNAAVMPVLNTGATIVFGNFTAPVCKSWDFDLGRKHDNARLNLAAANAYAGMVPSGRMPKFKFLFEATALQAAPYTAAAAFDPYQLWNTGTVLTPVSVQLNTGTQYNRIKIAMANAQVTNVVRMGEGPTATVEMEVTALCSTPLANDDVTITCD